MYTIENWIYVLSGFGLAWSIATVLYGIRQMKQAGEAYKATSRLHQITNAIIHKTGANRAILVKAENGGKLKFITILIDSHTDDVSSVISTFQRRPADKGYVQMLEELLENGTVVVTTEDLKDSDFLKRVYHAQKTSCSVMFLLYEEKNKGVFHWWLYVVRRLSSRVYLFRRIYYLEVSTTDEKFSIMSDEQFTYIEGEATNATNTIKEAADKKLI